MKNLNLIKRLWTDSHEKQSPQRFARYAAMLIMLLTIGVGQMWADNTRVVGVAATNASNGAVIVKANIGDNNTWWNYTITSNKAGITFEGKKLYVGTMNEKYGGVDALKISVNGTDKQPYSSWTNSSTFQNRIFNYDASGSPKYSDVSMTNGARVYFDATGWSQTAIKLVTGHANHQKYYTLSAITNTKLYYGTNTDTWSDAMGCGIVGGTSRSGANDQWLTDVSANAKEYTGWKNYGLTATSAGNAYLFVNAGKAGEQPTISYHGTHYSTSDGLNYTQTIKYALSTNGGTPVAMSSGTTPGKITMSSYKFVSGTYNAVSSETPTDLSAGGTTYTRSFTAARTATTTLTVSNVVTGYEFVGWYTAANGGTELSTSTTYTYYPTSAKTVYARFREKMFDCRVSSTTSPTTGGTSQSPTSWTSMGQLSGGNISVSANTGYTFKNWTILSGGAGTFGSSTTASTKFYPTKSSELKANFTANTYVITLDKNGGDSDGEALAVYDSTAFRTIAHASRTSYTLNGYYTAESGGTKVISADGSFNNVSSWITGGYWKKASTGTLYAQWTYNPTNYAVTYDVHSSGHGTLSAANTSTSAAISSGDEVASGTGVTFTASPSTGYTVDGWFSNSACTSPIAGAGTGNTYETTISGDLEVYVKFKEQTWSVAFAAGTGGTVTTPNSTPRTVGQLTGISIAATPSSGYTFNTWTITSGSGSFTSAATTNSNTFKPTAASTVTASFTETKSTITVTTATSSQGTLKFGSTSKSWGSTASVGVATSQSITATAADGFTFVRWDLSGAATTASSTTSATITLKADGSGSTGTATAVFAEDLTSTYYVEGDANGPFSYGWNANANTMMMKRTGYSTSSDVYWELEVPASKTSPGNNQWEFKIYNDASTTSEKWYGWGNGTNHYWLTKANNNLTLSTTGSNTIYLKCNVEGTYTFHVNYSTPASPTLEVIWPVVNQLRISSANPADAGNTGNYDLVEGSDNDWSVSRNLNAGTTYTFKMVYEGDWYGKNSTNLTRASNSASALSTDGANMTIETDVAGSYTFTFNSSSKNLTVTYPTAYTITYGVGTLAGCDAVTTSPSFTSGDYVLPETDVTFSKGSTNSGYTWKGWYSNVGGTGDAWSTTDASLSLTATRTGNISVYACYNVVNYTITYNLNGGSNPGGAPTGFTIESSAVTLPTPTKTGYTFNGWYENADLSTGGVKTTIPAGSTGNKTYWAKWTPITYTIHFNGNGNTSGSMTDQTGVTYDAATTITANAFGKTGYNFGGWATTQERANAGTVDRADGAAHGNLASTQGATAQLWAVWTGKQCTLTLDQQTSATGYGSSGTVSVGSKATYDAAMPSLTGTMPTAAQGYAFMGFYSGVGGSGTQYYDGSGNSVHNWDVNTESTTTLYAYYKKAEITALTFDAGIVEPEATVGVTPTISPTPIGTTIICWTILHSNDTPLDPQPAMTWSDGKLTFAASTYSGTYKVQAVLRTGNDCSGGTSLDTETASFLVAGSHTVTVNYKCGDDVIKTATSVTGGPTDWSDDITAPDIFGYTFSSWSSADGVTIKDSEHEDVTSSTEATIKIKAIYAGSLTVNYTQKQMIYFKNTLGWENVYVNFYTGSYWNNPKGSGNNGVTNQNLAMTQYGETDIWYYDYGAASITPSLYVSFTSKSQSNSENFWHTDGVDVVYPANYADNIHSDRAAENGFKAATPMFVPLAAQDYVLLNGKAHYYNAGYWSRYTPGTGYRLEIYNEAGNSMIKYKDFESADDLMPMKAVLDLEGGQTYKFQIRRGGESSAGIYYGNSGTMDYTNHGQDVAWDLTNYPSMSKAGITTNAAGDYTFNLSYSAYHNKSTGKDEYRLRIAVDYPVASGDYRLVYSDAVQTKPLTSAIVNKVDNGTDIVSFFVRPGSTPVLRIQQATVNPSTGAITWNEYPNSGTPTNQITGTIASTISSSGTEVYNFNLSMNGSGALTVASAEVYDGKFYIRTDAANSKWDNYRTDPDHLMTYSEYSIDHGGYTHYYCHWVDKDDVGRKNVKFVIANDYSPNISDTLAREMASGTWANIASFMEEGGDLKRSANVRFMWDKRDNSISRAYVDGAQGDYSSNFLYMLNVEAGADKIKKEDGTALTDHKVTFKDNGNWMYEANIKAQPTAQIKLLSNWGTENTITQYFRGASDDTETLLGGSGETWYDIRIIYDFKTNRLIAGLIPSGTIDDQMAIHADVMFVREHHGDIAQLTFAEKDSKMGAITDIETAFGVLQFSKWTINNKSKADGHAPLSPLLSRFERDLFYVSFPFKVAMEEVFGFGTYGQHWIIEEYDGASRAVNGYWAESGPNWKFVWNRKDKFFEPGQGYIIALELDEMGESSDIWANTDRVELYFPSYGTMDNITSSTATYDIPAHLCTINRSNESNGHGGTLGPDYDRRVKDSHWNVLGVPTYINPDAPNFANTAWTTTATETSIGPNFLYQWNMTDNSVSAVSAKDYTYHAMHAYLVQYCGDVTWTSSVSVTPPAGIAARRMSAERPQSVEFRLEMLQNDVMVDQTYVKLSDDEHVTTGFEFNYDMSKEFNKSKANIYTLIGTEPAAGNVLPLTEQTTVVPVGVKIATNGDYTFSIPEGTEGIGITLIDNETGIRTSLSALDYTINLSAGEYTNRFFLEISPIKPVATGIEQSQMTNDQSPIKKVLIDGLLYIVKDGKMFDARGAVVK